MTIIITFVASKYVQDATILITEVGFDAEEMLNRRNFSSRSVPNASRQGMIKKN